MRSMAPKCIVSFRPPNVSADRMMALASKRMRYLKDKLIADLENPAKIFVLKVAWDHVTTEEIEGLSRAVHRYGPVELLCVCAADQTHPEGTVVSAAAGIYIGYIDFSGQLAAAQRHSVWEGLCRAMLRFGGWERITKVLGYSPRTLLRYTQRCLRDRQSRRAMRCSAAERVPPLLNDFRHTLGDLLHRQG